MPRKRPGLLAAHHFVQQLHGLFEDAVGLAGVHLVGPNLVGHVVQDVAHVQGVQDGQEEIQVHFQAGFGLGLVRGRRSAGRAARGTCRNPALRRASRYSDSYMPKRQGPQAPAVKKT